MQSAADAVRIALEQTKIDEKERNVLLAHQFVTGAKRCDAEELQVGDVDQIPAELFASFEYVALGHIHSPQKVGRETVRYCGAPLKLAFSEAGSGEVNYRRGIKRKRQRGPSYDSAETAP